MQSRWAAEAEQLAALYSLYPDYFGSGTESQRSELRIYCVKPDGKPIHNVTWKRGEDLESLEYALNGIIAGLRKRDAASAARYAGVLAHFLEDSTCPAHAAIPADSPLNLLRDLLPPPPGKEEIKLHTVIERSTPEFDLGSRAPRSAGSSVQEAAANLLDRCYTLVKQNRAGLIELVKAVYADDEAKVNRFRLIAARAGAELLADAYYTAFVLAGEAPP